ncbi:hypothetical protein [Streptomyces yaizuensis]|uniref:Phosphoribosyltransferase n=1 Tax=Streptomyces yaizuensis TaxID=2989713 RepID=A0ABQ5NRD0_9ACTN|nr:hypothetical protein [Streptomyces sp. YSPA8]GLF92912.1 hypothetical protein SYYSPA8_01465 [Streptomyces sp. YSPA8]
MKRLLGAGGSSLYAYTDADAVPARVLVCSTPSSRRLLTDPTVCGGEYRRLTRTAVAEALGALAEADVPAVADTPADGFAALDVLRGGLSFAVEDAIGTVLGADPTVSFVGTERPADGPVELVYDRWELGRATTLVVGDIIGTGGTLARVLTEAVGRAAARGVPLRSVVLLTIGSLAGVRRVAAALAAAAPDGGGAPAPSLTVVALESLYDLPDLAAPAPFTRCPFDLLRSPAVSAPEYERERLRAAGSLFERCAVYDGGVRSFTPAEHAEHRSAWWADVVERGVPLTSLAALTAGLESYRLPLDAWLRALPWAGLPDEDAAAVHLLGQEAVRFAEGLATHEYVRDILTTKEKPVGSA